MLTGQITHGPKSILKGANSYISLQLADIGSDQLYVLYSDNTNNSSCNTYGKIISAKDFSELSAPKLLNAGDELNTIANLIVDSGKLLFSTIDKSNSNYKVVNSVPLPNLIDGNDTIDGGSGNDTIYGGSGNDTIKTGAGDDKVYGEAGDDIIIQNGSGSQTYDGGSGTDTLKVDTSGGWVGTLNKDYPNSIEINMTTGIVGQTNNPNKRDSFSNIENITFIGSFDTLVPTGDGNDNIIIGDTGNDTIKGENGNDTLDGGSGNDTIYGGSGNDTIKTGAGDDKVYGEVDDIIIQNGCGSQTYDGGSGQDTLKVDTSGGWVGTLNKDYPNSIEINMTTGIVGQTNNPNKRDSFSNIENITFIGSFDTLLTGDGNDNIIIGDTGNDTLDGGNGKDTLDGGAGNDTLKGGTGDDTYHYTRVWF